MKDDELRRMLSDLDPMSARVPVEPVDSPQARHRLEQIMSTDQNTGPSEPTVVPMRPRRRGATILAAAASVAVVAFGIGTVANMTGDAGGSPATDDHVSTVALTAPAGDMMASCMFFDAAALRMVPMALSGTITSIEDKTVTIDVDRWYKGGDADRVTITRPPGDISPALIPGVDFVEGEQFYISAYDNTVNGCGFSGPATPEMKKVYDEAFPG